MDNSSNELTTNRLRQLQSFVKPGSVISDPGVILVAIAGMSTIVGVFTAAYVLDLVAPAIFVLIVQTILAGLFLFSRNYDTFVGRALMAMYAVYNVYIILVADNPYPILLTSTFSYPALAFVALGTKEGAFWSAILIATLTGGGIYHGLDSDWVDLSIAELVVLISTLITLVVFIYVLDVVARRFAISVIEEQKKSAASQAQYNVLLNSVGDGLIAVDSDGLILYVNQTAQEMLDIPQHQLIGQAISSSLLLRDDKNRPVRSKFYPLMNVLSTGERLVINTTSKARYFAQNASGKMFPIAMTISPVRSGQKTNGAIMLFSDMTEIDRMDKAKSEFVSLASHQLRTPLNVVAWYSEKLLSQKKGKLNAKQVDYLEEVHTNNERMIKLVSELLNVSRVDLGRFKLKHEEVNISQLLQGLIKEIEPEVKKNKIKFKQSLTDKEVIFKDSDTSVVTVIMQNIISNAIKYTPKGGRVSVDLSYVSRGAMLHEKEGIKARAKGVLLSVSDSGIGIPKSQQDKIFGKLFRADNVSSVDVQGTGLGLYVTRSFTYLLDGEIWFISEQNSGTTFYIYLPIT